MWMIVREGERDGFKKTGTHVSCEAWEREERGVGEGAREKKMNRVKKDENMRNSRKKQNGRNRRKVVVVDNEKESVETEATVRKEKRRKMWVTNRKLKCGMKNERNGIQAKVI